MLVYGASANALLLRVVIDRKEIYSHFRTPDAQRRFAAALPDGATVAAPWDATSHYLFAAPHARYLNVLDPVFLHAVRPDLGEPVRALFSGRAPDAKGVVRGLLASDYVAFPRDGHGPLLAQLTADPRFRPVWAGLNHLLFRCVPVPGFRARWERGYADVPDARSLPDAVFATETRAGGDTEFVAPVEPAGREAYFWARSRWSPSGDGTLRVRLGTVGTVAVFVERALVLEVPGDPEGRLKWTRFIVADPGRGPVPVHVRVDRAGGGFLWFEETGYGNPGPADRPR
jgi:hypothetical protein